jgi:general nucleoside transport system ATP-binding protein
MVSGSWPKSSPACGPVTGGQVSLCNCRVTNKSPRRSHRPGLSHIPEDRMHTGLVANMTVCDNLILKEYRRPPLARSDS